MTKKKALGRGLDALITMDDSETQGSSFINEIALSQIEPNPEQPRRAFDEESMEELAASIKSIGVIQPITLRKLNDDSYQIIAGERRYRASQMAGLESIPAYIKIVEEEDVMEMALIENIQREDLNSIEIALAYQNLIDSLSLTQEQLSERVGKKRTTITNYLRLLKLPAEVQMGVKDKKIDMGHARALVTLNDPVSQLSVYNLIIKDGLSVRNVESVVKEVVNGKDISDLKDTNKVGSENGKPKTANVKSSLADDFEALKNHLSDYFRTDVQFVCNKKGKGKISISFQTTEELGRIIGIFDQMKKK